MSQQKQVCEQEDIHVLGSARFSLEESELPVKYQLPVLVREHITAWLQ